MMRFFSTIGGRMLVLVGGVILLNVVAMVAFYTKSQEQSILSQNEVNMGMMAEAISHGLQSVMVGGYADIARSYSDGLKRVREVEDIRILRMDGNEAFQDNKTINDVNKRIGDEEFQPRQDERVVAVFAGNDANFEQVLRNQKTSVVYHGEEGKDKKLTFLVPILTEEPCYRCHGKGNPVRGVLKLTTSLASVHESIDATQTQATMILVVSILGSLLIIGFLIRYSLVRPIDRVTSAMAEVARGDFSQQVPVMGMDELARMATSFNTMTREVLDGYSHLTEEQNKLTTIILSAREAIVVSNAAGEVVIVNPAAERILEKSDRDLMEGGFLSVVDDSKYVRAFLDKNGADMPDTLVYKGRILNFYAATIQNKQGVTIGSAALIRDVTEEKRLEEALRLMSYTDKLTGLFNRRRLEELLSGEYSRARRYSLSLSVLFFDVDHFKKFNDTYGHDMGDKVLEVIGQVAKSHFRSMDYACRYGGEEFCIISPNTGEEGAFTSADRFRELLEKTDINGVQVTCSIGVATFPAAAGEKWEDFLKLADNALYEAKRLGRNRVVQWCAGMTGKGV